MEWILYDAQHMKKNAYGGIYKINVLILKCFTVIIYPINLPDCIKENYNNIWCIVVINDESGEGK